MTQKQNILTKTGIVALWRAYAVFYGGVRSLLSKQGII